MGQAVHTSPSAGALILSSLHVLNTDPDTATIDKVDIPQRHESLYFEDDTVVFLIETTLFKVHRYFLKRHSRVFADMFSLSPNKAQEGCDDNHPIHIPEVSRQDFERLLSLFYPDELAITRLLQLASPIDRVLLARQFDVSPWLRPAYLELCKRDEALTLDEGMRLGMRYVIMLSEIRQSIRANKRPSLPDGNIIAFINQKLM
ncbi:hypothetical protein IEO21_01717 [Rhodonia placenta]|uniref:BTB domain-containing protein n=1 Tax=Rhodonia placenta TaxID=104341 RepID=A0A8H7U540_9APHY|nr:hypothetical protein IEO21_01717 [Postia placenta]